MAQKQMLRAEVYARALRASQNLKRGEVWAAKLRGERGRGGSEKLVLNLFVVAFGPVFPAGRSRLAPGVFTRGLN